MASFLKLSELLHNHLSLPGVHLYLVRHGQSLANHAGSIVGWTDSKLSIKGREQANRLFRGLHAHSDKFTQLHSSDLVRCKDTLNLSLGFPARPVTVEASLRELNFGDDEGVHFDSLPEEQKKKVNSLDYQAPNGENWGQAR
jgi:alpha-ribazole phosphatase